mmetsp:Transcript_23235/g.55085  ORF Transcript_23235/g.55085 Transcript_23235/m.55085 type:complete len:121 (+) Transcript_23235:175-537(+)
MSDVVVSTDDSLCGGGAVAPTAAATGPGPPTGSAVGAAADIIIVLYVEEFVPYGAVFVALFGRCVLLLVVVACCCLLLPQHYLLGHMHQTQTQVNNIGCPVTVSHCQWSHNVSGCVVLVC